MLTNFYVRFHEPLNNWPGVRLAMIKSIASELKSRGFSVTTLTGDIIQLEHQKLSSKTQVAIILGSLSRYFSIDEDTQT